MLIERANTRGNNYKLLNHTFHCDLCKHFFCMFCKYMEPFADKNNIALLRHVIPVEMAADQGLLNNKYQGMIFCIPQLVKQAPSFY